MTVNERDNYLATFDILLITTMLSNDFNEELEHDTKKIIDFVGKAFHLDEEKVKKYQRVVPDDLTIIATTQDADAFLSNRGYLEYPDIGDLLYIKAEVLLKLDNIFNIYDKAQFNQHYFDYDYLRPYFANIRYRELESSSIKGNVVINRTVALLLALGIGCEKNVKSAIYRFKQCAYWGDVASLFYLSYLYQLENDEKNTKLFSELSKLGHYLLEGRTMIPEKEKCDEEVHKEFELISSIKQDIVLSYDQSDINFSFVEVILMESVDYFTKMHLVNTYREQSWKEFTNSSYDPAKRLGFKVKGGK